MTVLASPLVSSLTMLLDVSVTLITPPPPIVGLVKIRFGVS